MKKLPSIDANYGTNGLLTHPYLNPDPDADHKSRILPVKLTKSRIPPNPYHKNMNIIFLVISRVFHITTFSKVSLHTLGIVDHAYKTCADFFSSEVFGAPFIADQPLRFCMGFLDKMYWKKGKNQKMTIFSQ